MGMHKRGGPCLGNQLNVGKPKIFSLGQELLPGELGQRVGKAISEVETGGVAAFAIFAPGGTRDFHLLGVHRNYFQLCSHHE